MTRRGTILTALAAAIGGSALAWQLMKSPSAATVRARLSRPLAAPTEPLNVFHLGHSLVNRDMPAMLAQLAPTGHRYHSQLGWGTTLKAHWGDDKISGFETENAHPRFRPAREAVASGDYDAVVLTEMIGIRASLRYFDGAAYFERWVQEAVAARPDVRVFLYETWHPLDDPEGFLDRIDRDLDRYWLSGLAGPGLSRLSETVNLHLIPAGQVLAAFVRRIEADGGLGGLKDRTDLFGRTEDGQVDNIHLNDLGNYLVALVHYAALYQKSPVGLPFALARADGTPATAPGAEVATAMQETAFEVVQRLGMSGFRA